MKRKIAAALAAVAAGVVLAGCDLPEESLGELMGVSTATVAATAPTETASSVEFTEAPTEPAPRFEVGQQIWAVYRHEGGIGIRSAFVVSEEGDMLVVTTAYPGADFDGEILRFSAGSCYGSSAAAWAASGLEPAGEGCE